MARMMSETATSEYDRLYDEVRARGNRVELCVAEKLERTKGGPYRRWDALVIRDGRTGNVRAEADLDDRVTLEIAARGLRGIA